MKEEPLDIEDDPEWERAAEAEILAANEGYLDTPSPEAASARLRRCPSHIQWTEQGGDHRERPPRAQPLPDGGGAESAA